MLGKKKETQDEKPVDELSYKLIKDALRMAIIVFMFVEPLAVIVLLQFSEKSNHSFHILCSFVYDCKVTQKYEKKGGKSVKT